MGVVTVIYGVLMLLVGAAAWAEIGAPALPALVPIVIGTAAVPLGLLGGDLRARRPTTAAVFALALLGLVVSIPGTISTLSLLFDDTLLRPDAAAAQVASFVVCSMYIVITTSAWLAYRRRRRLLEGRSPRGGEPRQSAGYATMGR